MAAVASARAPVQLNRGAEMEGGLQGACMRQTNRTAYVHELGGRVPRPAGGCGFSKGSKNANTIASANPFYEATRLAANFRC